ncbi:MAG: Aromatic ring-hydroxylating dioxygenase subunit alpha [Chloroflexi bacterium]|nr:Aromatic ring-hydroxylating dioxygenase subunit alpha [Chloroflexota bacterium]
MLTREENELLTRVGPGTPAGELLRRYWMPVGYVEELADQPTKFVRIMGEDLVLFKNKGGHIGLLADHCSHRGASLLYGRVEERGIACAYHGWLYDTDGNVLECPAEPAGSQFHRTVKHVAYPVREFIGMYWAYLGPLPAPEIPRYDVWVRKDGRRTLELQPQLDANWLQPMENSADPAHLQILHQTLANGGRVPPSTTRGFTDDVMSLEFFEFDFGLMKRRTYKNGKVDHHPLLFPNILRQGDATQIRVPIDDTHTQIYFVHFEPTEDGAIVEDEGLPPLSYTAPYKSPPDALHPFTRFDMTLDVQSQDHMAWETQGPIYDRTTERLATSDRGVVMLREMLLREIEGVQQGRDPKCLMRDPQHPMIDTNLSEGLAEIAARRGQRRSREAVAANR